MAGFLSGLGRGLSRAAGLPMEVAQGRLEDQQLAERQRQFDIGQALAEKEFGIQREAADRAAQAHPLQMRALETGNELTSARVNEILMEIERQKKADEFLATLPQQMGDPFEAAAAQARVDPMRIAPSRYRAQDLQDRLDLEDRQFGHQKALAGINFGQQQALQGNRQQHEVNLLDMQRTLPPLGAKPDPLTVALQVERVISSRYGPERARLAGLGPAGRSALQALDKKMALEAAALHKALSGETPDFGQLFRAPDLSGLGGPPGSGGGNNPMR